MSQQVQQHSSNSNTQNGNAKSSDNQQASSSSSTASSEDPHFARLAEAAKELSKRIQLDSSIEQNAALHNLLNSSASQDYIDPPNSAWYPFLKKGTTHFPDALFDEYDVQNNACYMGLFPEVERAWITIDHRLYFWDYQDGSGFISFEEIQDIIIAVSLVKPRPGIFIDSITHLLVISTRSAVHLIGLSYAPAAPSSPQQQQQPPATFELYLLNIKIATGEGWSLNNLVSTSNGRIFGSSVLTSPAGAGSSAGKPNSGDLHEIIYSAKDGWFSSKAYLNNLSSGGVVGAGAVWDTWPSLKFSSSSSADKVSEETILQMLVDRERELLYLRRRNNSIELWNLQKNQSSRTATVKDVRRLAGMLCPGTPLITGSGPFDIIKMELLSSKEGRGIGMVCVTNAGIRLYFTHLRGGLRGGWGETPSATTPPSVLELVHVRLPSPFPPPDRNRIRHSYLPSQTAGNVFLSANEISDDRDQLLLYASNIGRVAQSTLNNTHANLSEFIGGIEVEGHTWTISELTTSPQPFPLNELKFQLQDPKSRREWLILTDFGISYIQRQRPVDVLINLLETTGPGGRDDELRRFVENYGRDQTCAMLVAILSGCNAIFSASSPSTSRTTPANNVNMSISSDARLAARQAFFDLGERPKFVQRGLQIQSSLPTAADGRVVLSGRHEGIAIYFGRIVSPLMSSKIVVPATTPQNPFRVDSNVPDSLLMRIQRDLAGLRAFIDAEAQHFETIASTQWNDRTEAEAFQAELHSLIAMRSLLTQTIEAISFILLLIDYRLPDVVASCPPDLAKTLVDMTYADLLTTSKGRDIARNLVSAIINIQIGQNLSVDAVSDILQQRCGSFCSADDVLLYKAIENIRKAKTGPPGEKTGNLRESLRLFTRASSHLSSSKLNEVVVEYNSLGFYVGAIDLCLTCANTWDAEERGLSWWKAGCPRDDGRASSWEPRNFCYSKVLETLQSTDEQLDKAVQGEGKAGAGGSREQAQSNRANARQRAMASPDEAFHYRLYDWHLEQGLTDQLLDIKAPYLEFYLLQEPMTLQRFDLLWQYYARHYQHIKAAHILARVADSTEFGLTLDRRLEYLSLASSNAKAQFPNPATRQDIIGFLTEVDEKLEVGTVQVEIYRTIEQLADLDDQQKEELLSSLRANFFGISELYSQFAEPLNLLQVKLLILHISEHQDEVLVERTWRDLIHETTGSAPSESEAVQELSNIVTVLARRFYPSDVALPISLVVHLLEERSMQSLQRTRQSSTLDGAWIPLSLHKGGIPYDVLFQVYDDLIQSKTQPWHTQAGASFLLPSIVSMLSSWLKEVAAQGYSSTSYGSFPVIEIEAAVGRYLADTGIGGSREVKDALQEISRDIKIRFY